MRYRIVLSWFFLSLIGIHPVMGQDAPPPDVIKKMPHITASQAYYLFQQNKIILLDVHDGRNRSKIIGAYYIPSKKIKDIKLKIPKDQLIGVF